MGIVILPNIWFVGPHMKTMEYISTRGATDPMPFQDAVLTGLAPDGGLLVPAHIPDVRDQLDHWKTLSYQEITFEIMRHFVDLPDRALASLIDRSYVTFRHPEVAPAEPVGPVHILELFHGPTLAFKDIALQFLSNFFDYALTREHLTMNVLAATSGDTGSAAIHGVRGREHMNIFCMHPKGRVAPLQERQMTTVLSPNVFNLAVEGTFDDCQNIMKTLFADLPFKEEYHLGAVNSVNWARVLAQIVYYFSAGLYVMDQTGANEVQFSVPTGNFGNILAGYYASRMGLPVKRLILATNENDILSRVFNTGIYERGNVVPTLSPSMDIQVASNFERYLYYAVGEDPAAVQRLMDGFKTSGRLQLPTEAAGGIDALYAAGAGDARATLDVIRRYVDDYDYVLDPHTACGVHMAEQYLDDDAPVICLATAHPAKFPAAIEEATGRSDLAHHEILDAVMDAPTRCVDLPADLDAVREYIRTHV